jgi:hypothetical protein
LDFGRLELWLERKGCNLCQKGEARRAPPIRLIEALITSNGGAHVHCRSRYDATAYIIEAGVNAAIERACTEDGSIEGTVRHAKAGNDVAVIQKAADVAVVGYRHTARTDGACIQPRAIGT